MAFALGNQYSKNGHDTGRQYLSEFRELLYNRQLDSKLKCDKPTQALGNCGPYGLMQQLNRPNVLQSLSEEIKILS